MLGFFKDRKLVKYANEIYGVLAPQIELVKQFGKWPNVSTLGDELIDNDYLLAYLNGYINVVLKLRYKLENHQDCGKTTCKVLEFIEPTFSKSEKLYRYMDNLKDKSGSSKFTKGSEDLFMTCLVMLDMKEQDQFKNNKIYKEAFKYFEDGEFERDQLIAQRLGIPNSAQFSNTPKRFIVAHRIFEKTFGLELTKQFKFKNPII